MREERRNQTYGNNSSLPNAAEMDAARAVCSDDSAQREPVIHISAPPARKVKGFKELALICALIACVFVAVVLIVRGINNRPYLEALKLFDEGKYQESIRALEDLWIHGEKDLFPIIDAVIAFREYDAGDVKEAHKRLEQWSEARRKQTARYLPAQYEKKILEFQARVDSEYEHMEAEERKERARQQELTRQRNQKAIEEARERLKDQWPYIGMPEAYISYTRLGSSASFRDLEKYDYPYRVYTYKDANGRETYAVTCKNHVVTDVWDKVNDRILTKNNTWKSRVSTRPASSASDSSDPYNAKDYTNEEDFYDDHYDDFFDYYQAEEYWRDHQ